MFISCITLIRIILNRGPTDYTEVATDASWKLHPWQSLGAPPAMLQTFHKQLHITYEYACWPLAECKAMVANQFNTNITGCVEQSVHTQLWYFHKDYIREWSHSDLNGAQQLSKQRLKWRIKYHCPQPAAVNEHQTLFTVQVQMLRRQVRHAQVVASKTSLQATSDGGTFSLHAIKSLTSCIRLMAEGSFYIHFLISYVHHGPLVGQAAIDRTQKGGSNIWNNIWDKHKRLRPKMFSVSSMEMSIAYYKVAWLLRYAAGR